jgi:hypothetical protein
LFLPASPATSIWLASRPTCRSGPRYGVGLASAPTYDFIAEFCPAWPVAFTLAWYRSRGSSTRSPRPARRGGRSLTRSEGHLRVRARRIRISHEVRAGSPDRIGVSARAGGAFVWDLRENSVAPPGLCGFAGWRTQGCRPGLFSYRPSGAAAVCRRCPCEAVAVCRRCPCEAVAVCRRCPSRTPWHSWGPISPR